MAYKPVKMKLNDMVAVPGEAESSVPVIRRQGRDYIAQGWFCRHYGLSEHNLWYSRKLGLPCIKVGYNVYINKQDFHDFFAGLIGKKERKAKSNGV